MNTNTHFKKAVEIAGGVSELARRISVSASYVWQMKNGKRPVHAAIAVAIERATGGQVTRKDLRPHDWQDIWPELSQSLSNQGLGQDAGANSLADKPELAEKGE